MSDIFVSYSRKNLKQARRLANDLRKLDYRVWMDESSIPPGTRWPEQIPQGLDRADVVLILLTDEAQQSEWVEREILYAQNSGKKIYPLQFKKVNLPFSLLNTQVIDFSNNYREGFIKLVNSLPKRSSTPLLPSHRNRFIDSIFRKNCIVKIITVAVLTMFMGFLALYPQVNRDSWLHNLGLLTVTDLPSATASELSTSTRFARTSVPYTPTADVTAIVEDSTIPNLELIVDDQSLTLHVISPRPISLDGIELGALNEDDEIEIMVLAEVFDVLQLTDNMAESGACFVLIETQTHPKLPEACTEPEIIFRTELVRADIFWYDSITFAQRTIVVLANGKLTGQICSAEDRVCEFYYQALD